MQVLHRKEEQDIPRHEAISFRNALGAVELGKLTLYPIDKTYLIETIATVDQNCYKDTRYNIAFFLASFLAVGLSCIGPVAEFQIFLRLVGVLLFLAVLFYKKEQYVLTIIFVHRKAVSFKVSKQQFKLSGPLLHAVSLYQLSQQRMNALNQ